jgi:hypothetical protein
MKEAIHRTKAASISGIIFRLIVLTLGSALVAYGLIGRAIFGRGGAIALAIVMAPIAIGVGFQQFRLRKSRQT